MWHSSSKEMFKYLFLIPILSLILLYDIVYNTLRQLLDSGRSSIKPDQLDPWIKDQVRNALLSTILSLQLPNFVSLPHDTKFGNCRGEVVDRRVIFIWSLIYGSSWSGLINVRPGLLYHYWGFKGKAWYSYQMTYMICCTTFRLLRNSVWK